MTDHEGGVVPLLRLWIGYRGAPDARETGQVIERLANAYTQTLPRVGGRQARLAVEHLRIGSLLVDLKAAFETGAAIVGIIEQRELLVGFVQRVALTIQAVRDASLGIDISPSIRNFLYSFVRPVVTGRASEARLHVEGDNNVVIVINSDNALELDRLLERLMPARGGGGGAIGPVYARVPVASETQQGFADTGSVLDRIAAGNGKMESQLDRIARGLGHAQRPPERIGPQSHPNVDGVWRRGKDFFDASDDRPVYATGIWTDGIWYARPEGLGGAKLPTVGLRIPAPEADAPPPLLVGRVERDQGGPVAFRIFAMV